jgi:AcrR family transcriptional regulator
VRSPRRAAAPAAACAASARERILRAAAHLYASRGYAGTSMREIADAARATKPLVYYHFGSKEQLFSTLLRESIDACRRAADEVVRPEGRAVERLRSMLRSQFAQARQAPEVVAFAHEVMTMPGLLPLGFDYKAEGRELIDTYVQLVVAGQRTGEFRKLDARVVVTMAFATVAMYVAAVLAGELDEIPAHVEDAVYDILVRGVAA